MKWYLSSYITYWQDAIVSSTHRSREYWCIFRAESSDSGYSKGLALAKTKVDELNFEVGGGWEVLGLTDLLVVLEEPSSRSELMWVEQEIRPADLEVLVLRKDSLRAFDEAVKSQQSNGWYICKVVMEEVHDTGSHGDSLLVWTNYHLIREPDRDAALTAAVRLGEEQQSGKNGHRCDSDFAHWEFKGLGDLIPAIEVPQDGATLWFDEFEQMLDELRTRIPSRSQLSVFAWERRWME